LWLGLCGSASLGGLVNARANPESQAYLECGSAACGTHSQAPYGAATGIDDLNVGGDLFDVTFTSAPPVSPFVLSSTRAAPGQPLTGINAADAIEKFYGSLLPPYGDYPIAGDQGPAFITAFGPAGSLGAKYGGVAELFDIVQTNVGAGFYKNSVAEAGNPTGTNYYVTGDGHAIVPPAGGGAFYTTWTPVRTPELDPSVAGGGLALLVGGIVVLRGRRAQRQA